MTKADWRDELWARRSELFDGSTPFSTGIGTLPVRWRDLVGTLCGRLAAAVAGEPRGHLPISRMEADRAAMTVDWQATAPRAAFEAEIGEIVARATARSACTCAICGSAGKRYRASGRTIAACPVHADRGAVEIATNWPTIRIRRCFVAGRSQIVECSVYDRKLDCFVATSPAALGIKDSP